MHHQTFHKSSHEKFFKHCKMTPQVNFHNWAARPFFPVFFSALKGVQLGVRRSRLCTWPEFVSIHPKSVEWDGKIGAFQTSWKIEQNFVVCFPPTTENLLFYSGPSLVLFYLPITIERSISTMTGNVFLWKMGKTHSHANPWFTESSLIFSMFRRMKKKCRAADDFILIFFMLTTIINQNINTCHRLWVLKSSS